MAVYLGIDEAGYGPLFGPLTIACAALRVPETVLTTHDMDLWQHIGPAVAKDLKTAKKTGGIAVADSKQLTGRKTGLQPLETGCLSFALAAEQLSFQDQTQSTTTNNNNNNNNNTPNQTHLGHWLQSIHAFDTDHPQGLLPWYAAGPTSPWDPIPFDLTQGQISISASLLQKALNQAQVNVLGLRSQVIFEDQFNQQVSQMHNKALVSFNAVQQFLYRSWQAYGHEHVFAAVDRQGGRKDYRQLLQDLFPKATLTEGTITDTHSGYQLKQDATPKQPAKKMTIVFETKAETKHMPVALASMTAKWTRERLMHRFNQWWGQKIPGLKPTKGYGTDGNRWWRDVTPHLRKLNIDPRTLRRQAPGK